MVYLLTENENGNYEKNGVRYDILEASWAKGPRAKDFVEFDTLAQAEEHFGLTRVEE